MKYVFFGSPEFAKIILENLIAAGMPPALVICNPDKPVGRKKIVTPPLTKVVAIKSNIPVWQPDNLATRVWPIANSNFDFFVVAAYAKIIPKAILDLPRLGTIGVHPSLLPKYRGATPIQSVILAGEKETGVTLYLMDEKVDHGEVIVTRVWPIANRIHYETLMCELAQVSADLLLETIPNFINKKNIGMAQDHSQATFTKKFSTEDGFIDLEKDERTMIDRKVRALNPDPGVYTFIRRNEEKVRMKILETSIHEGKLRLEKIQLDGKKPRAYKNLT